MCVCVCVYVCVCVCVCVCVSVAGRFVRLGTQSMLSDGGMYTVVTVVTLLLLYCYTVVALARCRAFGHAEHVVGWWYVHCNTTVTPS
jgi:hypothetical protein